MLGDMTPEWNRLALSITQYVLQKHKQNLGFSDDITEYNAWLHWSGLEVRDPDLAQWCVEFIRTAGECPERILQPAAEQDQINPNVIRLL